MEQTTTEVKESAKKKRRVVYRVKHKPSGLFVARKFPKSPNPFELTANGRFFTTQGYIKTSFKGKGTDWREYVSRNGYNLGTAEDYEVVEYLMVPGGTFKLTGKWLSEE